MKVKYILPYVFCSSEPPPGPVAQLLERATSSEERAFLSRVTENTDFYATLLPIYSVGVQVTTHHVLHVDYCGYSITLFRETVVAITT